MPIYLDNKEVLKIYRGDHNNEVDRVYLGNTIIFQRPNTPTINSFEINPTSINRNQLPSTGHLTITFSTTNSTRNVLRITDGSAGSRVIPLTNPQAAVIPIPTLDSTISLTASNIEGDTVRQLDFVVLVDVSVSVTKVGTPVYHTTGSNIIGRQNFTYSVTGNPIPTLSISNTTLDIDSNFRHGRYSLYISRTMIPRAPAETINYVISATNGVTSGSTSFSVAWRAGLGG